MALADLLNQLPPNTRRIAIGTAAAGALYLVVRSRSSEPAPDPDTEDAGMTEGGTGGMPLSYATDAIGVDQLAEFESHVAEELAALRESMDGWDKPQNPSTTPPPAGTVHWTVAKDGETPNAVAIRLRGAGAKTADGRAITAAYLIRFNQWTIKPTARLWTGTKVAY